MKPKSVLLILLAAGSVGLMAAIVAWRPGFVPDHPLVGRSLPAMPSAEYLDGRPFSPEAWRGRVVLVSFWAVANFTIGEHVEQVDRLRQHYADDPRVRVVGFNVDLGPAQTATREDVRAFLRRKGIDWPQLVDVTGDAFRWLDVEALPRDMIIGPDGIVRGVWVGHDPDGSQRMQALIDRLLPEAGPATAPAG